MSVEENKKLYLRYQAALRAPDTLGEVLASDFVTHDLPPGMTLAQFRRGINVAFPDQTWEVLDMVAEGDRVAGRVRQTQTHLGVLQGIPPTGKNFAFELLEIIRVDNGKIAERWVQFDREGLMQQLKRPQ